MGAVHQQAAHLLSSPHIDHAGLRGLPSNKAAEAATPPMHIAGLDAPAVKPPASHTRNQAEEERITAAGRSLAQDMKNPNSVGPSEPTYHRIEGLIQDEYKEHGDEGLKYIEKSINKSFEKAQKEQGLKGAPKTFEFGENHKGIQDARVAYPDRPKLHHDDFDFRLAPK
jgi:hypothetical protein